MGNFCCREAINVDIFTRNQDKWTSSASRPAQSHTPEPSFRPGSSYGAKHYAAAARKVQNPRDINPFHIKEDPNEDEAGPNLAAASTGAAVVTQSPETDSKRTEDALSDPHQPPKTWHKGELLGEGAFGKVFSCLDVDTGQLLAVKEVKLDRNEANRRKVEQYTKSVEAEIAQLSRLQHENIVQYRGTSVTSDCLNIFLEYVPGGSISSLLEKFGPFGESVIKIYVKQILQGLEYIHSQGVLHRDIKGANLLVDKKGTVKLADFGASRNIENLATVGSNAAQSFKGTPFWMAPEVIKQTGHGRPADIWSVGCTIIEMATGKPPWSEFAQSPVSVMFQIASSKDPPPYPDNLSPEAKDFLRLCFNRVPRERANASTLLQHPFLQKHQPQAFAAPSMINASTSERQTDRQAERVVATPQPGPSRGVDNDDSVLHASPRTPGNQTSEAPSSLAWTNFDSFSPLTVSKKEPTAPHSAFSSNANSPRLRPRRSATPAHSTNYGVQSPNFGVVSPSYGVVSPNVQTPQQQDEKSYMTLNFNPIQEPSWAPSPENAQMAAVLKQVASNSKTPGSNLHSFGLASSMNSDCVTSVFNPSALQPNDDLAQSDQTSPLQHNLSHKVDTGYSTACSSNLSLDNLPSPQGWSLRGRTPERSATPASAHRRVDTESSIVT